ncbi:DUF547 domain-containing protein [uncultured Polaribacter sp.]|uniref:DUF547 domain-containing protein n=1 Tax=uncultured Polaribacter sp. TaxID=174711 RepID=UPI002614FA15|nr:DUF547 domain-containing protein [uncultured Polaribacter sp.]
MKKTLITLLILLTLNQVSAQTSIFNNLLQKHVSEKGIVDYKSLKNDKVELDSFISYLEVTSAKKSWSAAKTKAFWANAYNAYTLKIVLENYPLKSIIKIKKDGKDAWNIPFAKVGGKTYTLNQIEHDILRKNFKDPKIHVAVNCASGSCPQLGNFAFTEANYESKTEDLMKKFINDPKRNIISEKKVQISKLFEWYKADFTTEGSVIDYLNKYANVEIKSKAKIKYLTYNWNLNGK